MNTHRIVRTPGGRHRTPAPQRPGTAAGWMLVCTALGFCGVAWLIMQWASHADAVSVAPPQAAVPPLYQNPGSVSGSTTASRASNQEHAPAETQPWLGTLVPATSDPIGTLLTVLAQQGDGIALVGGAVLGGIVLLLFTARHMTRIPKDPLATGLGRTLTLLENDHRAGTLTPQRALELARQAVSDIEQDHERATLARTRAYEEAVAQLTKSHAESVAAVRAEATHAVKQAQADASAAGVREATALQRVANTEAQVVHLSRDLAHTHEQLVATTSTLHTREAEITTLNTALEEATDTLVRWQSAHKDLSARYLALQATHAHLEAELTASRTTATDMTLRAHTAEAHAQTLQTEAEARQRDHQTLTSTLATTQKELARLRVISLQEVPLVIPDREADLTPPMAAIVGFIRGTTVNSGSAGGARTTKPVLSSWRDIRRLLQVLKGVGVRFAVPAHHIPAWVPATGIVSPKPEVAETSDVLEENVTAPEPHASAPLKAA